MPWFYKPDNQITIIVCYSAQQVGDAVGQKSTFTLNSRFPPLKSESKIWFYWIFHFFQKVFDNISWYLLICQAHKYGLVLKWFNTVKYNFTNRFTATPNRVEQEPCRAMLWWYLGLPSMNDVQPCWPFLCSASVFRANFVSSFIVLGCVLRYICNILL